MRGAKLQTQKKPPPGHLFFLFIAQKSRNEKGTLLLEALVTSNLEKLVQIAYRAKSRILDKAKIAVWPRAFFLNKPLDYQIVKIFIKCSLCGIWQSHSRTPKHD